MKTTRLIAVALLALASASAFATNCRNGGTNWPTCTPPSTPQPGPSTSTASSSSSSSATSNAGATSSATVGVVASPSSTSTASGGSVGSLSQSYEEFSRSNMYVLPAPVQAAPLPPGLCPQGDSMSIGILWNMFSYSRSSTRTEMECLDKVLASIRGSQSTAAQVVQAPVIPPSPPALSAPATTASVASNEVKKPEAAKAPAKNASGPKKSAGKASPVPSCEETALKACQKPPRT